MCSRCVVDDIINMLDQRKGFDEWWDSMEYPDREAILDDLQAVIREHL